MGSSVVLEETFGAAQAREMMFTGRLMKGRDLRGPHVAPRAQVGARARELATEIAAAPREVLVSMKAAQAARRRARLEEALVEEKRMHDELFSDPVTRQRVADAYGAIE
jgi:polyketide biosynthesis enoyl-CoA hydratase PksI